MPLRPISSERSEQSNVSCQNALSFKWVSFDRSSMFSFAYKVRESCFLEASIRAIYCRLCRPSAFSFSFFSAPSLSPIVNIASKWPLHVRTDIRPSTATCYFAKCDLLRLRKHLLPATSWIANNFHA